MSIINKTKYLEFKSAKSPSGNDWYYVKRTNDTKNHDSAVVITTLIKQKDSYKFLLLKTSRPPITAENKAEFCLESPAGLIGDENSKENLFECVKKELLEETGMVADEIHIELTNCSTSAGLSSETLTFVTAIVKNDIIQSTPSTDGGVIVERFKINADRIFEYLKTIEQSEISIASATICGIFYALNRLAK